MEREILYRGKRIDNGEWVYGYLCSKRTIAVESPIGNMDEIVIDTTTVGQYTGLTDKNGVKIFEGDVVKLHYFFESYDSQTLGAFEDENEIVAEIRIDGLGVLFVSDGESGYLCDYLQEPSEELEVISNIHDNPELLEVTP